MTITDDRLREILGDDLTDRLISPRARSDIADALYELLALRQSSPPDGQTADGWQDISTAPKDGTYVIVQVTLFNATAPVVGSAYYRGPIDGVEDSDTGWWWAGESPGDYYAERIYGNPDLWQSLPAPRIIPTPSSNTKAPGEEH